MRPPKRRSPFGAMRWLTARVRLRRRLIPASIKKTLPNHDQVCLESALVGGLLIIMLPKAGDGPANHMKLCALGSESQPKLVIHAVVKRRIDVSAGSLP